MVKPLSSIDHFRLDGKICVVTGGGGLIGSHIVIALAQAGGTVISADVLAGTASQFEQNSDTISGKIVHEQLDICNSESAAEVLRGISSRYGSLDVLVNCAYPRTSDFGNRLELVSDDSWRKNVDMHMNGYCLLSRAAAELMKENQGGSIVNIASVYGMVAPDFSIYEGTEMTMPGTYAAIKGGIIAFSRYLSSYYGPSGVRVNVVSPGGVFNNQPTTFLERYSKKTLLGRLAQPAEIAAPVLFLASSAASYITGVVLPVDGGWTAV